MSKKSKSRRSQSSKKRRQPDPGRVPDFQLKIHPNAAGIDIGSQIHYVAVPSDRAAKPVRSFGAFTSNLYSLADWLQECGIETVVMESTGVYWIPLMQVLEEREFEVLLVDPHHLKSVPGRKSDVLDCQWLQQLHTHGLLRGAFRPPDQICRLRSLLRHRETLIRQSSDQTRRMQKALTQMNLQLTGVLSDITGTTGMKIIRAIVAGERCPEKLASFRDHRCRRDEATIAEALRGHWRHEHLFALKQTLDLYDTLQRLIVETDGEIEVYLQTFEDRAPVDLEALKPHKRKTSSNEFRFDAHRYLIGVTGVDLTLIEGFGTSISMQIISEIGLDMNRWPTDKHFGSWLGLCPGCKISGGKKSSSRTRPSANRAATAFRMAAYAVQRSKSWLGAHYRKLRARMGAPKAITAVAYKMARIVYAMLKKGESYVTQSLEQYEQEHKERSLKNLKRKARTLGYDLTEKIEPAPVLEMGATG